jgi:hypothetical protein
MSLLRLSVPIINQEDVTAAAMLPGYFHAIPSRRKYRCEDAIVAVQQQNETHL